MKTCGSNRWWLEDARLFIRRERGAKELLLGIACLLVSAGLGFYVVRAEDWDHRLVVVVLGTFVLGLYNALGVWEVTLHGGRGRVSWAWGLGVPLFQRTRPLTAFDRVQVTTPEHRSNEPVRAKDCVVQLAGGNGAPHLLAGSDDRDEALTLAEAVARHARLGVQVGGGRVRSYEELVSSAPGSARARPSTEAPLGTRVGDGRARSDEARDEGTGVDSAFVEPSLPPPPGCRVQVREAEGRLEVLLPAPDWEGGYLSRAVVGVLLVGLALVACGFVASLRTSWELFAAVALIMLVPLGAGVAFVRRALEGVRTTWRVTVTRPGLEVVRDGRGAPQTTRVPALVIRDVDVRVHREGAPGVGLFQEATCPMLVIERQDGTHHTLGAGLPLGELKWAAARLRQALARFAEARRQPPRAG
jgi:hypothetical protein